VHDLDAVLLEFGDVFLRLVAGGLDDLDAALDDGLAVFRVRRRLDRGKDGEVDAERLVGQAAAARDFLGEVFRRRLRQRGDEAERAGIGDGRTSSARRPIACRPARSGARRRRVR
jgi:hypothetical protein